MRIGRTCAVARACRVCLPRRRTALAAADVLVFAAASLKEALDEQVSRIRGRRTGDKVVVSYGASNALAKQIEAGAPADLFISADLDWMDYVDAARARRAGHARRTCCATRSC